MKETDYYFTIESSAVAEFKDRGSKFLAYSFPLKNTTDFKKYLQDLKKEHPKAVHHCFAWQ
jgi:putative IMPACT (imprinted ancient) family translation regulator